MKSKIKICTIIILIIYLLYYLIEYIFIPENINLTAGEKYSINLDCPFKGTISPQSAQTIYINNKVVDDNINIDLNNEISMHGNSGKASLKVKFMGLTLKDINLNVNNKKSLCAVGKTVGICIDTKGILVLGTGSVKDEKGNNIEPAKNVINSGDIITKVNNKDINSKEELLNEIAASNKYADITFLRDDKLQSRSINVVKSADDGKNKIGLWVRDSTQGVGTVTYYDKTTGRFGALGHPITDVDTGDIMKIDTGEILLSEIKEQQKGIKGTPGALIGAIDYNKTVGTIDTNNINGIYGYGSDKYFNTLDITEYPVGYKADVKKGDAYILANIDGNKTEQFNIRIDALNKYETDSTKNFTITVTDKRLIEKTGGIVQGMSGSPILQNGKIVGAVTHVFVNDPTRGYGIFIENMLETAS